MFLVFWADVDRCFAYSPSGLNPCTLRRLVCPKERASLDTFYSHHFSKTSKRLVPPPSKETDEVYTLVEDRTNSTIAAIRLCPDSNDKEYVLLRSLCVSRIHRRQGLALKLMQEAMDDYQTRNDEIVTWFCFADKILQTLYEQAGFVKVLEKSSRTPEWMWRSYNVVARRMKRKRQDMKLFVKLKNNKCHAMHVILLQHTREHLRPTSTARLFSAKNDSELSQHVRITVCSWSGRADNERVVEELGRIEKERGVRPALLWTGGNNTLVDVIRNISPPFALRSFIILDGTWQEARAMYRKLPILQTLPRASIHSPSTSTFTLRKDFTGWRDRFRVNNDESLLCTAEIVAALLDERGESVGGSIIRQRLEEFQRDFGKQ